MKITYGSTAKVYDDSKELIYDILANPPGYVNIEFKDNETGVLVNENVPNIQLLIEKSIVESVAIDGIYNSNYIPEIIVPPDTNRLVIGPVTFNKLEVAPGSVLKII